MAAAFSPPIRTRSGFSKSLTAVPSAKNSGLESTSKVCLLFLAKISLIFSAVRTGRVDFSTTMV